MPIAEMGMLSFILLARSISLSEVVGVRFGPGISASCMTAFGPGAASFDSTAAIDPKWSPASGRFRAI
jgi:hypothetical protein